MKVLAYVQAAVLDERCDTVTRYCANRGLEIASLILDPRGERWAEAFALLVAGEAETVVVIDHQSLPWLTIIRDDRGNSLLTTASTPPAWPKGGREGEGKNNASRPIYR